MVPGRILERPQIHFRELVEEVPQDNNCEPTWNMKDRKVHTKGTKQQWMVLKLGDEKLQDGLQSAFRKASRFYDVRMTAPALDTLSIKRSSEDPLYEEGLKLAFEGLGKNAQGTEKLGVLIVILPKENATAIHARVKFLGDTEYGNSFIKSCLIPYTDIGGLGIHTICLQSAMLKKIEHAIYSAARIFRKDDSEKNGLAVTCTEAAEARYLASVVLKYNLKTGGINHMLQKGSLNLGDSKSGIMFIGIDMAHHTLKSKTTAATSKTVVGVVANSDANCAQWPGDIRFQSGHSSTVEDLESIVRARLQHFKKLNKSKPSEIIVYRAGVSDGQHAQILKTELPMIRKACKDDGQIPVAMIVISQGHQGRFFRVHDNGTKSKGDKHGKCEKSVYPAGTVVDRDIGMSGAVAPGSWDFFLQAHAATGSGNVCNITPFPHLPTSMHTTNKTQPTGKTNPLHPHRRRRRALASRYRKADE